MKLIAILSIIDESAEGQSPHNPALMPCPLQGTFPFIIEHLIYVFCYGPTTGDCAERMTQAPIALHTPIPTLSSYK